MRKPTIPSVAVTPWSEPALAPRVLSSLALALFGCSAPAVIAAPPKPSTQEEAPPSFASPARWAYFPREPGQPTARLELSGHRCVVLTDAGDRWLVHGTTQAPCQGLATASSSPVYEPLVGAIEAAGEYQFISQTGTIYVANEPLGAFVRVSKPPQQLHQVAASKTAIVGVDEGGNAYYFSSEADGAGAVPAVGTGSVSTQSGSTQSGSWKRAKQPTGSKLFAVGVDERGRALAVGVPETLYTSTDGGKSYALATSAGAPRPPHVGALAISRSKKGELAVEGVMGSLIWEDGGSFSRTTEALAAASGPGVSVDPSPTPTTTAVREGRAQVTGDRYYDLRYPNGGAGDDGVPYVLARGPLAGPLETVALHSTQPKAFADCTDMRLAAHGKAVVVACSHTPESGADLGVTLFVSTNGGDSFEPAGELTTPSFSEIAMGVGADGSTLLTNVCRPGGDRRHHKDDRPEVDRCHPRGAMLVRIDTAAAGAPKAKTLPKSASTAKKGRAGKKDASSETRSADDATNDGATGLHASFVQGNAPQLQSTAFSPVVGPEGKLYFLGRRKKDDRPAIFVSTDGGHSYEARQLEAPQETGPAPDDGTNEPTEMNYANIDFSGDGARLTIDDSGTLGLACDSSGGYVWVTADADGRVATVAPGPEQGATVGGWGRRVVSIGYGATDGVIRAWESNDGAQSFTEIATTAAVGNYFNGDTLVACDAGGCLLGETLARIGWEGQVETSINMADDFPPPIEPKLRSTLACELTAKSKWTPVKNLAAGPSIYPRLYDMMRGTSAWALMTRDPSSGEIDVTSATLPERPQDPAAVQTHVLLSGGGGGRGRIATVAKPQAEGFVAAKALVPETKGRFDAGKPVDDVEIGWANFYTGTFGKRTIRDAGTWTPSLASGLSLTPALLTVTGPGVVFRAGPAPKSVFLDAGGRTEVFDYPDWSALGLVGPITNSDAALVGGKVFAIGFIDRAPNASVFASAFKPKGATAFQVEAVTYGLGSSDTDWVYLGAQNGVSAVSSSLDQDSADSWAQVLQVDGSLGERIPMPTLRDLGDRPRPCSADDRKNTPRTISSAFGHRGTLMFRSGRQAIQVTEGAASPKAIVAAEPIWYLSDGAVLYGTPKDPCLAGVRGSAIRHGSVVVVGGDLEHAWMFRPAAMATSARPVCNCNPDDPLCQCPDDEPAEPPSKKQKARTQVASVEFRPMTCKVKPELVPPYEVTAMALVRSPEDVP